MMGDFFDTHFWRDSSPRAFISAHDASPSSDDGIMIYFIDLLDVFPAAHSMPPETSILSRFWSRFSATFMIHADISLLRAGLLAFIRFLKMFL